MTHNDDFNDVDEFRFPESLADEYMDKSELAWNSNGLLDMICQCTKLVTHALHFYQRKNTTARQ